jgi:hypothetical protein
MATVWQPARCAPAGYRHRLPAAAALQGPGSLLLPVGQRCQLLAPADFRGQAARPSSDVAGVDVAKQEVTEVVEFLKYTQKFVALGARIPKGVLMVRTAGSR